MKKIVVLLVCFLFAFPLLVWAMLCPKCEAKNSNSAKFCIKCGANLRPGSNIQTSSQAQPQVNTEVNSASNIPVRQALKGPKKTIAVLNFENKTNFYGEVALGDDFSDQLTHALMQNGQFNVLTRQELSSVISEQDLAASDRFAASKTAVKGKLIPSQILIKGAVTEFEAKEKGGDHNINFGDFGAGDFGIKAKTSQAHMAVIVYIIDTTTGQVLDSQRVIGHANGGGLGFDYSYGSKVSLGSDNFKKTPLGSAAQNTIQLAVNYIADKLSALPWEGHIIKAENGTIYLNSGKEMGIKQADVFTVYSEGEALTDPVTGATLGVEKSKVGKIEVTDVQDKFAKAKIIESQGTIKRGDLVTVD